MKNALSKARLEQLLACSPSVIYACKAWGDYAATFVSENIRSQLGYEPRELTENPRFWIDRIHPEDLERVLAELPRVSDVDPHTIEYRFQHKDGTYHWMLDQMRLVRDEQGSPVEIVGHWVDISEHKRTEVRLRESERLFRQLAENINQVFWMIDSKFTEIIYVSPAYERIWGRSCRSLYENPKAWLEPIHPEDIERVLHTMKEWGATGHILEYRIILPDGSVRWILDRGFPIRDESGEIFRLAGIAEDITEHKFIAEESERYRMHLDTIMRSIDDGIVTVDTDMRVTYVNEALRSICRCLRSVRIGALLKDTPCPCESSCFAALHRIMHSHDSILDFRVKCGMSNKPDVIVILNGSLLLDHAGQCRGAVLTIRDITRIEELEKKLLEGHSFGNIIGKSERMQEIYGLIESLADLETTVLILGESGTGKELVAEALHFGGAWSSGPLVKVSCSALPESLLESELFGHVRGAFTGAVTDRKGRFEAAEGGTILLDEIGDISPLIQLKLLRILESKEFERVGESKTRKANVRVVAATNGDLPDKVRRGLFREDLFYRLNVMPIHLPPLRERNEDIPLLTDHFIRLMRSACSKNITGISNEVMDLFMGYEWPGNIRELKSVLEHACILCRGGNVSLEHLPKSFGRTALSRKSVRPPRKSIDIGEADILEALRKAEGKKARAARLLGISRNTLYRRIEQIGIKDKLP